MKEYEVEALIEQIFRRHGAAGPSYTSIIGGGANATCSTTSQQRELRDGELLLVDAGAEYKGYASTSRAHSIMASIQKLNARSMTRARNPDVLREMVRRARRTRS